jgi:hypothetical protein
MLISSCSEARARLPRGRERKARKSDGRRDSVGAVKTESFRSKSLGHAEAMAVMRFGGGGAEAMMHKRERGLAYGTGMRARHQKKWRCQNQVQELEDKRMGQEKP